MSNRFYPLLALVAALHGPACFGASDVDPKVAALAESETSFATSLYAAINTSDSENIVFSPYSVHTCLSMVYIGARNSTAKEMKKALVLPFGTATLPSVEAKLSKSLASKNLQIANALWLDVDTYVLSDFRHAIVDDFQAKMQSLDFSKTQDAILAINEWTSNQTQGKITDLLQNGDIDENTRLVLTNAVYFKGDWQKGFDPKNTTMDDFYPTSDESIQTKMMEQTGFFPYFEDALVQLLALPFKAKNDESLACLILLPKDPSGLATVEKALSSATINGWISSLDTENINIQMPSFCFKQRINLNDTLMSIGMKEAFSPQANFSGIDGMRDLFLSKVVHEAFFSLDEAGVTAAAATAASINVTAVPTKPVAFTANRPFLFFIVDLKTKTLLFMGKLTQPTAPPCS